MVYNIYLDDSGQLHCNYKQSEHFIYGGFLISDKGSHKTRSRHKKLVKQIKHSKDIPQKDELKTAFMSNKDRTRLLKAARNDDNIICPIFAIVSIDDIKRLNFNNDRDVTRYKNYIIRRMVEKLLNDRHIPPSCERVNIFIDNQNVAHSAQDSLEDYLISYFNENNYINMGNRPEAPNCTENITVQYKDSKHDYMIQLADLLANTCLNHVKNPDLKLDRFVGDTVSVQLFP